MDQFGNMDWWGAPTQNLDEFTDTDEDTDEE